mmetsp:Transcript_12075/g.21449  ORF Transcript_12075/g.21449 Transcript_12075/m.21449 type:complete len:222 (+) Transcript_12075:1034-1699(+)
MHSAPSSLQRRAVRSSDAVAARRQSWLSAIARTRSSWPCKTPLPSPLRKSQSLAVPSQLALATRSTCEATELTQLLCPRNSLTQSPELRHQTCTTPMAHPVAMKLSAANATVHIGALPSPPSNFWAPDDMFQTLTLPSIEAVATMAPLIAMSRISFEWLQCDCTCWPNPSQNLRTPSAPPDTKISAPSSHTKPAARTGNASPSTEKRLYPRSACQIRIVPS